MADPLFVSTSALTLGTQGTESRMADEYFGRRMQLLNREGGNRFFGAAPELLVDLAMENTTDEDMLSSFVTARNQVEMNQIKSTFESLPEAIQKAEFTLLHAETQKLLLAQGYTVPEKKQEKPWYKKMFDYETFGMGFGAAKVVTGPVSFAVSTAAKTVLAPFDFTARNMSHVFRAGNAIAQAPSKYRNPSEWGQVWQDSMLAEESYHVEALEQARNLIGDDEVERLKRFLASGPDAVYADLIDEGKTDEEARDAFYEWYGRLSDPDFETSINILEKNVNSEYTASLQAYNAVPFWDDVTPESLTGRVVGTGGSLSTMVLMDPFSYAGKAFKVFKGARLQFAPTLARQQIAFLRNTIMGTVATEDGARALFSSLKKQTQLSDKDVLRAYRESLPGWKEGKRNPILTAATTPLLLKKRLNGFLRVMFRVNDAFAYETKFDDAYRAIASGDSTLSVTEIRQQVVEQIGHGAGVEQLVRDFPQLTPLVDDMVIWQERQRRSAVRVLDDGSIEYMDDVERMRVEGIDGEDVQQISLDDLVIDDAVAVEGLETPDGYFRFLSEPVGYAGVVEGAAAGTDPDLMLLPSAMGIGTKEKPISVALKEILRMPLDFANPSEAVIGAMNTAAQAFIKGQKEFVFDSIFDDIAAGKASLSAESKQVLTRDGLETILNTPEADRLQEAIRLGLNETTALDEIADLDELYALYEKEAPAILKEAGKHDEFFQWHEYDRNTLTGSFSMDKVNGKWEFSQTSTPFRNARRAHMNYLKNRLHDPGGQNSTILELMRSSSLGDNARAALIGASYYPAKFAEKMTTYMPTQRFIDVTDSRSAVTEFRNLIDMGVLSNVPRSVRDDYLRTFIKGNESARWLVQQEFVLDFLGRSGALLHGGSDVQKFIQRFVRHGDARYAQLQGLDTLGIYGMSARRAIVPALHHDGHLSKLNMIPDYRELGAVSRYMTFYRRLGWGFSLPSVDKFISRTWRPAVLLRLGYVARNGGEELASWMFREGPRGYLNAKLTRRATGYRQVWNEYGQKIVRKVDDLGDEVAHGIIWGPTSRLWRSFNEVAGVGDTAITTDAIRNAVQGAGAKWSFLSPEQRLELFEKSRDVILKQKQSGALGWSRNLFDLAEGKYQSLMQPFQKMLKAQGLPTRTELANRVLQVTDPERHASNVHVLAELYSHPTMLDEHMKNVLGSFDTYLNQNTNSLDNMLRMSGREKGLHQLVALPMNYAGSELAWVDNLPGGVGLQGADRSVAVAQRLSHMSDDPSHAAAAVELMHFVSPETQQKLAVLADRMGVIKADNPAADILRFVQLKLNKGNKKVQEAWNGLRRAFYSPSMSGATSGVGTNIRGAEQAVTRSSVFWDDAVDEFMGRIAGNLDDSTAVALGEFLYAGTNTDVNAIAFLLNDYRKMIPEKITSDWLAAKEAARQAMANHLRTPEGQQMLISTIRANVGFTPGSGPVQFPLAEGASRVWVPMVPADIAAPLAKALSGSPQSQKRFFESLERALIDELKDLGHTEAAQKAALLLNPDGQKYLMTAAQWAEEGGTHMPLMLMSSDENVAAGISRAFNKLFNTKAEARLSSVDINNTELLSAQAKAAASKGDAFVSDAVHMPVSQPNFFGVNFSGKVVPAVEFEEGLAKEVIFATIAPRVSTGSGLHPVPMGANGPELHKAMVYRNRHNPERMVTLRNGTEINHEFFNIDDWDLVQEYSVTNNDLHNAAEELSRINMEEVEHLLTSGSRTLQDESIEVFYPWLNEVGDDNMVVDAGRILELTEGAQWWQNAPDRLLAHVPATRELAGPGEKIDKAWNTLLRNWFDGVVNPMIGSMVREPLFHHYYLKAYNQTIDVRRFHSHTPGQFGKAEKRFAAHSTRRHDGQLRLDVMDTFIRMDWPLANAEPDALSSLFAFALEDGDIGQIRRKGGLLKKELIARKAAGELIDDEWIDLLKTVAGTRSDEALIELSQWAKNRRLQFDRHRDVALKRAMHITSSFIDDHRIRSQFQGMVGTMVPFWFAEDQFLRRMGRSLKHNPLMFRNVNLTMMAGVHGGLVQEDQFGEKRLVYPGSGMMVRGMLEIADKTPIVNRFLGGDLASIIEGDLTTNIHIIPGYDIDKSGEMGFGPLLAVPMLWASQVDPGIRSMYENNLVGGRFVNTELSGDLDTQFSTSAAVKQMIGAVAPALVTQSWNNTQSVANLAGLVDDPAARSKAAMDVIVLRSLQGRLPTEEEIANQSNPGLFQERLFDEINAEATQLQLLQSMTWFMSFGTAQFSDLVLKNDNWEWNQEFYSLTDKGLPFEQAFALWQERIVSVEGEFNPYAHSPFRSKSGKKIPLSALPATQEANVWLTGNSEFVRTFGLASGFLMPRGFGDDDDEYSAEARSRQMAYGLYDTQTPEQFLEQMYHSTAYSTYAKRKADYQTLKFSMRSQNLDTSRMTAEWDSWSSAYFETHPIFADNMNSGNSKRKREKTIDEFRLIVANPELAPDTQYRTEIVNTMSAIVAFKDEMDSLKFVNGATPLRNQIKFKYYNYIRELTDGKPWLNELYYSVFMPLIGDSWIAKLEFNLLDFGER